MGELWCGLEMWLATGWELGCGSGSPATASSGSQGLSDKVRLLFLVKPAAGKSGIDLIAELPTAIFDSARRIENRRDHFMPLLGKVFPDAAEIVDCELLAKAQNPVNQNDIDGFKSYQQARSSDGASAKSVFEAPFSRKITAHIGHSLRSCSRASD
jgi:hypothetical protein